MFDCVIIGAGPAGGSAAYHLARRGRSVLVIEKESLPRYKPCGGGVSPQVAQWFDFDFGPAIVNRVNSIRFTWQNDDAVEAELATEPMWMVDRPTFDQFLVDQARAKGAIVKDGTAVTGISFQGDLWEVQTASGCFCATYLIAADGAQGPTAGWLGFKGRRFRTAAVLEVTDTDTAGSTQAGFDFGSIKNGYIWKFPKQGGYSIGIGTFRGSDPGDFQADLMAYARLVGLDPARCKYFSFPVYLWDGHHPLHKAQALLVGETAGLLDPFTAEGIRPAMLSGVEAAVAIEAALMGDGAALAGYTKAMQLAWGNDMAWAQKLAALFYAVPSWGYKMGVKRPSALARLSKILIGEMQYGDVAVRALKRLGSGLIPGAGK
jgi:geranylgeranyl reductase family protein